MSHPRYSTEEIVRRGKMLYEQQLRPNVEVGNTGKVLVINIETGEYEMDMDHLTASDRAAAKYPGAPLFAMWIGSPALGRLGSTLTTEIGMITGQINANREAVIPLPLLGVGGQQTEVDAVIDTGFTDFLTLPPETVASLQLTFRESVEFVLGDGSSVQFETYAATVLWDGQEKNILVLASEGGPLARMSLLYGYRVIMDVIDGGAVTVEPRP